MGKQKGLRGSKHPNIREASIKASLGNQFWKLRSSHGRKKLFETPKLLWEAACEYFEWVDSNPFIEEKPMVISSGGNTGSSIEYAVVKTKRPYTIQGLCIYLGCNITWFRQFKSSNTDEDFSSILSDLEQIIYEQKFTGAAAGHFNASIISRDLGLVDRQDKTSGDAPIQAPVINVYKNGAPPLAGSEDTVKDK